MRPAKTQISLGIRQVWSESLLYAWRKLGSLATHWVHSADSDQTGRMPRLIWVFAGRTHTLLILSWGGSFAGEGPFAGLIDLFGGLVSLVETRAALLASHGFVTFALAYLYQEDLAQKIFDVDLDYIQVCTDFKKRSRVYTFNGVIIPILTDSLFGSLIVACPGDHLSHLMRFWHFVLLRLILQTRMRSNPVGLDVCIFFYFVRPFVYVHTSCVRTAKALARLRGCAGSPEPSLVACVISTIISWAGSFHCFRLVYLTCIVQ